MNVVINRMLACIKAIVADKLIKLIRSNIPNRNIVLEIRFLYLIGCNKDKNQQGIKIKIPKIPQPQNGVKTILLANNSGLLEILSGIAETCATVKIKSLP